MIEEINHIYVIPDYKKEYFIFPQTVEYNTLKYLIDMGFICIVGGFINNSKLQPICLYNRYVLDKYRKCDLVSMPEDMKEFCIKDVYGFEQLSDD